jgi:hypothetical protein
MGTAEQASNEIIQYLPMQLDFLGMTVRMQTLYMSWLACIITIVVVWLITSWFQDGSGPCAGCVGDVLRCAGRTD